MITNFEKFKEHLLKESKKNTQTNEGLLDAIKDKAKDIYNKLFPGKSKTFQEIYDAVVPSQGMANNKYGEICRAIGRLEYRMYNDGDIFNKGYGVTTCASDAAYLHDCGIPEFKTMLEDVPYGISDEQYEALIEKMKDIFVNLDRNTVKSLKKEKTEDSRTYDFTGFLDMDEIVENEVSDYIDNNYHKLLDEFSTEDYKDYSREDIESELADNIYSNLNLDMSQLRRGRLGRRRGDNVSTIIDNVIDSSGLVSDIMSQIESNSYNDDDDYEENED